MDQLQEVMNEMVATILDFLYDKVKPHDPMLEKPMKAQVAVAVTEGLGKACAISGGAFINKDS